MRAYSSRSIEARMSLRDISWICGRIEEEMKERGRVGRCADEALKILANLWWRGGGRGYCSPAVLDPYLEKLRAEEKSRRLLNRVNLLVGHFKRSK